MNLRYSPTSTISSIVFFLFLTTSCVPYRTLLNFDESGRLSGVKQTIENYVPVTIQSGDILSILVTSPEAETVEAFDNNENGFIVDESGMIDFPFIGNLKVADKTIEQTKQEISSALKKYFVQAPTVNLRISNFKINVNGEVANPGTFVIDDGKINLIEAITMAGDFTLYSKRNEVLVIRETNGERSFEYVDFNNIEMMNSPYFYLRQNDVVYVKPEKRIMGTVRTRQDKIIPFVAVTTSLILLITAVFNLR